MDKRNAACALRAATDQMNAEEQDFLSKISMECLRTGCDIADELMDKIEGLSTSGRDEASDHTIWTFAFLASNSLRREIQRRVDAEVKGEA